MKQLGEIISIIENDIENTEQEIKRYNEQDNPEHYNYLQGKRSAYRECLLCVQIRLKTV